MDLTDSSEVGEYTQTQTHILCIHIYEVIPKAIFTQLAEDINYALKLVNFKYHCGKEMIVQIPIAAIIICK